MKVFREYKCPNCGHKQDKRATLEDIIICDECASPMQRLISAPQGSGGSAHGFLKSGRGFN
ncbi:putative regulatory protein [Vibrio phage 1.262.O._10N.286.51.A9]|nr:putative regulatory protein [Vibrio phage 1.262.O._10N.286.51.A9]